MAIESPWITATTDATFAQDVIERSHERPVVVDFWASWCQPCLMLKPILQKLAVEYDGKFALVTAETEYNQAAAGELNVSSIPAVFGFSGGEAVDGFGGAMPEAQVRTWLDRLLLAGDLQATEKLEATDPAAAETKYRELLAKLPREPAVQIGLGRLLLALERNAEAQEIITQLEARGFLEPEAQKLKAAIELAGMRGGDLAALSAAASAQPNDLDAKLALASALAGAGRHEEALQAALAVLEVQKTGPGEQAKQLMLDIFRVLPNDSELTRTYRRKLTSLLY